VAGGPVARFITASTSIRGSLASDDKPTAIGSAKVTKRSHRSWRHGARASTKRLRVTATSTSARGSAPGRSTTPNQASEDAVKAYAGGAVRRLQPAVDSDPGRDRAILSFWWMGPAIYVACTTFAPLTGVRPERMGEWAPACARVPGARISWRWPSSCAAPPHTTRTGP